MAKVYFITCYRQVKDPAKLAAYAKLAVPAIEAAGGRFLARGVAAKAYEAGQLERTVVIEFESVAQVTAMYDSPAYQTSPRRRSTTAPCGIFGSSRAFKRARRRVRARSAIEPTAWAKITSLYPRQ